MENYDKILQNLDNQSMTNILQEVIEEYKKEPLLDWQGNEIDEFDLVYIVKYKKDLATIVPTRVYVDEFLNTYYATDDNLVDLLNEHERLLYWSMEITNGKDLM